MNAAQKKIAVASLVILSVSLLSIIYLRAPGRAEPVYHGKTLTKWLKQLDDGEAFGISSSSLPASTGRQFEAAEAIRAIGPAALPLLMDDIHATPGPNSFQIKFQRQLDSLMSHFTNWRLSYWDITTEDRIRWRAAQGLAALGPIAKPALPELKRLLFTNYFHSSIKEAAYVLASVGPEGIAILTNAVGPQAEWSGMCAIWALGQHPTAGKQVIPFLISATRSTSEGTACGAIQVLGLFHIDAEQVIPALTNCLTSANPAVRGDAMRALGQFGPEAASAVPLLESLKSDRVISATVVEALRKIRPVVTVTNR